MSLIVNGTEIENVIFNGTELTELVFNGVKVWEKATGGTKGLVYAPVTASSTQTIYKVASGATFDSTYTYFNYNIETNKFNVVNVSTDAEIQGLYYIASTDATAPEETGFYCIIDYVGSDKEIKITKSQNNNIIKAVNFNDFTNKSQVTKIIVEAEIIELSANAFSGYTLLGNIDLPNTLERIGARPFNETALYNNEANWSNGLLKLKTYLVGAKSNLTVANIDEDVTVCALSLFNQCLLETINFNAINMHDLSGSIFAYGTNAYNQDVGFDTSYPVTTFNIGSKVKRLPSYILYSGRGVTMSSGTYGGFIGGIRPQGNFLVNTNIEELGQRCFWGRSVTNNTTWKNITESSPLIIPSSIKSLAEYVGAGTVRDSPPHYKIETNYLSENMFNSSQNSSTSLDSNPATVILNDKITKIPKKCFFKVWSLTSLTIPKNVSVIENLAFSYDGGSNRITTLRFEQPAGMAVTLPTAGSGTGMCYCKTATATTIYTDNETIKNYAWSTDNITATIYHLDGSAW